MQQLIAATQRSYEELIIALNNIYNYVVLYCNHNENVAFLTYKIFLNQNDEFCRLKDLRLDLENFDEAYKDLFKRYGYDIRGNLLNKLMKTDKFNERKYLDINYELSGLVFKL